MSHPGTAREDGEAPTEQPSLTTLNRLVAGRHAVLVGIPVAVLAIFSLAIALIAHPPILGWWEASVVFHTFAPQQIWLNTLINPRADVVGYEYASLDISRYVAGLLGLNLFSIRLLPIVYGLVSLLLMYRILNRWHGKQVAVLVTALFATNQVFLTFQHQLIIPIVSFALVLLCIDRFLVVDSSSVTRRSAFIFGLVAAVTALHYQIGRYLMLAIVVFWLTRGIEFGKHFRPEIKRLWIVDAENWKYLFLAALGFVVTLLVLNVENLGAFFSRSFLSPPSGEHARSLSEALSSLKVNLPLIFHSFLGTDSFFGENSTDIIVSVQYQLLSLPILVLALVGIGTLILGAVDRRRSAFVIFLLFLTTIPLAFSSLNPVSGVSSLIPYRTFFALIPLYFLVAAGLDWCLTRLREQSRVGWKLAVPPAVLTVLALVGFQTFQYVGETQQFRDRVARVPCGFQRDPSNEQARRYACQLPSTSGGGFSGLQATELFKFDRYETDLLPYWSYARRLSEKIEQLDLPDDMALIIDAPTTDFAPQPINHHYAEWNFHQVFLAFYLAENDIDVNYFVPYWGTSPLSQMASLRQNVKMRINSGSIRPGEGSIRRFPLQLNLNSGGYVESEVRHFEARSTSGVFSGTRVYLATTEEEQTEALNEIEKAGVRYVVVRL